MLVCKALRKHGWPADVVFPTQDGFGVRYNPTAGKPGADFWQAVEIAVRIAARTHRVEVDYFDGAVTFQRLYIVTDGGHFKEVKP